jgi:hypothetical protein
MSSTGQTPLSEVIAQSGRQARSNADSAIRDLAEIADSLEMCETADKLRKTGEQLRSDTFKLIVMGRFKNGKSTLLNALLGGTTQPVVLEGHRGPMVVDDLPATATLTGVRYAEDPFVLAWGFDGKADKWTFSRYLRESTLDTDELESQRRFQAIQEFEMGYPARLCKEGVHIYDSPGLDEHSSRTLITREATKRCDAAVIVYRSDTLMGQSELVDAASVVAEGTRLFTVVNLWGSRQVDDRLRSFVWNRYVRDHSGGPAWNNQDLSQRDIYFVDADKARNGRYTEDRVTVEASGLADFERALAKFLVNDRQQAHLQKFATLADNFASAIDGQISQRHKAAQQDRDELKAAYAEQQPKLEKIRSRPAKLAEIFDRYRAAAQDTLTASLTTLIARIRAELPGHLLSVPLPSGEKYTKVLHQKKLQAEAAEVISDFVNIRINRWCSEDVTAELAPVLDRLFDEIDSEITAIARQFEEIHVSLGWGGLDATGPVVRPSERILAAAAGFILGGGGGAITGGTLGWRGTAGSAAGALATAYVLGTVIGVTSAAVFFPAVIVAALAAGIIAGGADFERRIKDKVLEKSEEMLARTLEEDQRGIAEKVNDYFNLLETTVTTEVTAFINEEERNIAQAVELNQSEQAQRERAIAVLTEAAAAVASQRLALQQSLVIARQT